MKLQRAPLGELCTLVKGRSPISKTAPGRYPLVTTGERHKTADTFQFDAEAVCIPLISSTGHGHASLKRVHHQMGKFALANLLAAALIKDRSLLSAKFLARYLMFTKDRLIVPLMTGAANMSISIDRLATVPIVFPTLGEQERIVKRLAETEAIRDLRAEADLRTSSLVPALFNSMFGDSYANGRSYPIVPLDSLCRKITDGTHKTPTYVSSGVPFVTVKNMATGRLDFSDTKFISKSDHIELTKRTKPDRGDILVSKDGTIGVACPVETDREFSIFVSVALLKVKHELVNPEFLIGQFNTEWVQSHTNRSMRLDC